MRRFWYVIRLDASVRLNGPTVKHASFESARREAELLCESVGGSFGVFEFKGMAEPPKRTVWSDAFKGMAEPPKRTVWSDAEDDDLEIPF